MSRERELFERAIEEAFQRQAKGGQVSTEILRRRIAHRGRRRRVGHVLGSAGLAAIIGIAAVTSLDTFGSDSDKRDVARTPSIGAERIMEFGGPLAAYDGSLLVANGRKSNDAGDKASIARFDVATGEITETDPTSVATPLNIAAGNSGLWLVQWTGDMPVGDGGRVRGKIELVDPITGEVLLDLPREDSAPYDVAVSEIDGSEVAWVVDSGRHELLRVDATSGSIESIPLGARPQSVAVGAGAVWVSSNASGKKGALDRYDLDDASMETFSFDHCVTELLVLVDSVWASDYCGGMVHRYDASTGEEMTSIAIGGSPTALVEADGLVWVSRETDIVRIDPSTGEQVGDPIVAGDNPRYLEVVDGTVFASSFDGVYRLGEGLPVQEPRPEPTPEEPRQPIALETCELDNVECIPLDRESSIAGAGFGTAWVGNVGEGKTFGIARFDAETGEEVARLRTDGFVQGFAVDERWMWVLLEASERLTLLKVDPATTRALEVFELGSSGNIGTSSVTTGGGYTWVSQPNGAVSRVDPGTGEITPLSYADALPDYRQSNGPLYLAYGDDRLWLSYGTGHVGVVDPASGELIRTESDALQVNAYEIVHAAGQLWAPHQTSRGKNVLSYVSTEGTQVEQGSVDLGDGVPRRAAVDGDRVWVVLESFEGDKPGLLLEVDPSTHQLVGEPIEIDVLFDAGVAAGDGYVWVTGNKVLYRIAIE